MFRKKFVHVPEMSETRNFRSIVDSVIDLTEISSVIDLGCGGGGLLGSFKERNIEVLGVDGPWLNIGLVEKNLSANEYLIVDFEKKFVAPKRYDLACSIEVAEHISEDRADSLVDNLVNLSDWVLFSAATKYQGGENHVNEQNHEYWDSKFSSRSYSRFDVFKDLLWSNDSAYWWIKQNMVLYVKKGFESEALMALRTNKLQNVIHKDLFDLYADYTHKNYFKITITRLLKHFRFRITGRK